MSDRPAAGPGGPARLVIDSNVALDLLVFDDPAARALADALAEGRACWMATTAMRNELARVLDYPRLAPRVAHHGLTRDQVLARFDQWVQPIAAAPRAPVRCQDPDDQIFVDLAWAHRTALISKDAQVLRLRKRLLSWGVVVSRQWDPLSLPLSNS